MFTEHSSGIKVSCFIAGTLTLPRKVDVISCYLFFSRRTKVIRGAHTSLLISRS